MGKSAAKGFHPDKDWIGTSAGAEPEVIIAHLEAFFCKLRQLTGRRQGWLLIVLEHDST